MAISIYFNPLDTACKSVIGGIKQGQPIQFNLFLLKTIEDKHFNIPNYNFKTPTLEECVAPVQNAFLRINRDEEDIELLPMVKTAFGWNISIEIHEIGLYHSSRWRMSAMM